MKRTTGAAASAALLAALVSAGCSTAQPTSESLSCTNTIVNKDAPVVTVWAWYPNMETVVDNFNQQHNDVQVCWNNVSSTYDKIQTAIAAGTGLPDVVQLEAERIAGFVIQDALVNLSDYGVETIEDSFNPGAWKDVSMGDAVYAVPVDGGPVGLVYRADVLAQYNLTPPTTWDEFAQAARAIKAAGGPSFSDLITNVPGQMLALMIQGGAEPFEYDPANRTEITIRVNDDATKKVFEFWGGLVGEELVSTTDFGTEFIQAMIAGQYATVPMAAWGPGYLASAGVGQATEPGVWAVAPLPQWDPASPVAVNWGGSTFAVTTQATDKALAAKVAMSLYADEDSLTDGWTKQVIFPLNKTVLDSPEFIEGGSVFFDGQTVNKDVFIPAANAYEGMTFSPFQTYFYAQLKEAMLRIIAGDVTGSEAADQLQETLVKYATEQGFTVKK